jgi:hypothetical protein
MNIDNIPKSGGTYTVRYYFYDDDNSRTLSVSVGGGSSDWLSATVNSDTRVVSITVGNNEDSDRTGLITPIVNGHTCSSNVIYISQNGETHTPTKVLTYQELIDEFNTVLSSKYTAVSQTSTPSTYGYLVTMYNRAIDEYDNSSKQGRGHFFDKSTYPEVWSDYHGSNTAYANVAKNAMTSWLMAMCLAEIVPDSGTTVNTQTKLFKKAYELGGGRDIPLYGNAGDGYYSLKSDVSIARLAASAVYAYSRTAKSSSPGKYSFSDVDAFRSELKGSKINNGGLNWILNYVETKKDAAKTNYCEKYADGRCAVLSYAVSAQDIFPSAAGPFITEYYPGGICEPGDEPDETNGEACNEKCPVIGGRSYPQEQVKNVDALKLFNDQTKNYLVDETIYNNVCSNYNLTSTNSGKVARIVQALADASFTPSHILGNTVYYKYNTQAVCYNNSFYKVDSQSSSDGSIKSVFNGEVTGKDLTTLLSNTHSELYDEAIGQVCEMVVHFRRTLLIANYGRRRPGEGKVDKTPRHLDNEDVSKDVLRDDTVSAIVDGYTFYGNDGGTQHRPVNAFYDENGNYMVDNGEDVIEIGNGECYKGDVCGDEIGAHSYPSGHGAYLWTIAMILIMMLPDRKTEIYKAAYDAIISRAILRIHWNSDLIYGRLITTMNLPVIFAVSKYRNNKSIIDYLKRLDMVISSAPNYN